MVLLSLLFLATCFLAYSDGANDNSKGVATLFGSGTTNYKVAIGWATGTTFLGSICSIFLAATLVSNFSGKGLVPDAVAAMPQFLLAVAIGAGVTVLLATLLGFPVSTTHSLVGALTGAGFVAAGTALNIGLLGNRFFLPLLLSPLIAAGGLLGARKVAETISHRITRLNHGQGFTANLVTGFLVVVASRFGLPVSTTHVSVGSLFGIGVVTRNADGRVVGGILLSWLLTLPVAAVVGSITYWIVCTYCMKP